jgi:hypothetical protein
MYLTILYKIYPVVRGRSYGMLWVSIFPRVAMGSEFELQGDSQPGDRNWILYNPLVI